MSGAYIPHIFWTTPLFQFIPNMSQNSRFDADLLSCQFSSAEAWEFYNESGLIWTFLFLEEEGKESNWIV